MRDVYKVLTLSLTELVRNWPTKLRLAQVAQTWIGSCLLKLVKPCLRIGCGVVLLVVGVNLIAPSFHSQLSSMAFSCVPYYPLFLLFSERMDLFRCRV